MNSAHKVNILLVYDSSSNLKQLLSILGKLQHNLVTTESADAALEHLLAQEFAAIVIDIKKSGIAGIKTATQIRSYPAFSEIPILFLTEEINFGFLINHKLSNINYLNKPCENEALILRLSGIIDKLKDKQRIQELTAKVEALENLNKAMQEKLDEYTNSYQQCENVKQELEAFNAAVCHDLRNPLTSIKCYCDLLAMYGDDKLRETEKRYLKQIQESIEQMGQMIQSLLNLSRGTCKPIKREIVDLSSLAENISTKLHHGEPDRQIELAIAPNLTTYGDNQLLKIVLENLIGNAWKFSAKKACAKIEFGVIHNHAKPLYFIRDNGTGFDMNKADKLFTPFQRLHEKEEFEGTGIGLTTVQRIILRHGGKIWAQAAPNQGATFWFTMDNLSYTNVLGRGSDRAMAIA